MVLLPISCGLFKASENVEKTTRTIEEAAREGWTMAQLALAYLILSYTNSAVKTFAKKGFTKLKERKEKDEAFNV